MLHARPAAHAQHASLAVLCTDPDIYEAARWCADVEPERAPARR
jgi:hypothetical protein